LSLVQGLDRGMVLNRGPKYRDWPRSGRPTQSGVFEGITSIGERIIEDVDGKPERWTEAIGLITRLPGPVRTRMLEAVAVAWDELPDGTQRSVIAELRNQISRHTKYRDSAWALEQQGVAELAEFVHTH